MKNLLYSCIILLFVLACLFQYKRESKEYTATSDIQHASAADFRFLRNAQGQIRIFKQIRDPSPDDQISIILEAVGSMIAHTAHIPLNDASLIPPNQKFDYRIFDGYPGSLHTEVSGRSSEAFPPWKDFDLHQKMRVPFVVKKMGQLPDEELGLTLPVIVSMSKHSDLPKIAALDTFLGNNDRSNPNIFYDSTNDRFFGIDMGNCFSAPLAKCAIEQLKKLEKDLGPSEIAGLRIYGKTLVTLYESFPPEETDAILDRHLILADFNQKNKTLWNDDAHRKLKQWKQNFRQNYSDSKELIQLINKYCDLAENEKN